MLSMNIKRVLPISRKSCNRYQLSHLFYKHFYHFYKFPYVKQSSHLQAQYQILGLYDRQDDDHLQSKKALQFQLYFLHVGQNQKNLYHLQADE